MAEHNPDPHAPIVSEYASDIDLVELIELFVGELPTRISDLSSSFDAGDLHTVQRIAHQLKGAAAGYGFPQITETAGELEFTLRTPDPEPTAEQLRVQIEHLVDLCHRVIAGGSSSR